LQNSFGLGLKILIFMNLFVIIRATYPRIRYDQLMEFCWKFILPLTLAWLVLTISLLINFKILPPVTGPLISYTQFLNDFSIIKELKPKLFGDNIYTFFIILLNNDVFFGGEEICEITPSLLYYLDRKNLDFSVDEFQLFFTLLNYNTRFY
jgi:hypothetical protein